MKYFPSLVFLAAVSYTTWGGLLDGVDVAETLTGNKGAVRKPGGGVGVGKGVAVANNVLGLGDSHRSAPQPAVNDQSSQNVEKGPQAQAQEEKSDGNTTPVQDGKDGSGNPPSVSPDSAALMDIEVDDSSKRGKIDFKPFSKSGKYRRKTNGNGTAHLDENKIHKEHNKKFNKTTHTVVNESFEW